MKYPVSLLRGSLLDIDQLVVPEKTQFDPYLNEKDIAVSPDNSKTATLESPQTIGTLTVNNEKIMQWDEIHPYVDVYQSPHWLPDNTHLVVRSVVDETIRIIELSSKKTSILDSGRSPKWDGQKNQELLIDDWE